MEHALTWGAPGGGNRPCARRRRAGIIACLTRTGEARLTNRSPTNPPSTDPFADDPSPRSSAEALPAEPAPRVSAPAAAPAPAAVTSGETAREVTRLLAELRAGDRRALEQLIPVVYAELRELASRYLRRERQEHTLQPTALVHEVYMRLAGHVGQHGADWRDRSHFFGIAARVMRQVLVDYARANDAAKRGAGQVRVTLDEAHGVAAAPAIELTALEAALTRLAALDPEQARLVELRFFAGLTVEETAEVVGRSARTVKREWRSARAWLHRELFGSPEPHGPTGPAS